MNRKLSLLDPLRKMAESYSEVLKVKCPDPESDGRRVLRLLEWLISHEPKGNYNIYLSNIYERGALVDLCELMLLLEDRGLLTVNYEGTDHDSK